MLFLRMKSLDEDTFVNRLGFPVGLVQAIKDELGVLDPQSPGGLRYKMHNAHEEGEGEEDEEGDEKSSTPPQREEERSSRGARHEARGLITV